MGGFAIAQTAFNEQINYQGKLTDLDDIPVENGDQCMKFLLFDVEEEGSPIWSEELNQASGNCKKVTTSNGLFSIMLGKCQSLSDVDFNQISIYLEVQYDPDCSGDWDEVFAPRKRLGAVPAAFEAKQLGGKLESEFATLTEDETITGAWAFNNILTVTASSTSAILTVNQTGSGNIVDFQATSSSKFVINNSGEITTGVWKATPIGTQWGGTGADLSTGAQGGIVYMGASSIMGVSATGTSGRIYS